MTDQVVRLPAVEETVPRWGQILNGGVEASAGIARLKARLRAYQYVTLLVEALSPGSDVI